MSFEDFYILIAYFEKKGISQVVDRILDKQIQNIWGSGGQSYAFVFDRFFFLYGKGKSALEFSLLKSCLC